MPNTVFPLAPSLLRIAAAAVTILSLTTSSLHGADREPAAADKPGVALRRVVAPLVGNIAGILGFPRDDHAWFLRAMRAATGPSPAALVADASRALADGDARRALDAARRARTILQDPFSTALPLKTRFGYWASASFFIGQSLRALGDRDGAAAGFSDAVVLARTAMRLDPADTAMRGVLAASEVDMGGLRFEAGDAAGAMRHFREAKAFIGELLDADSDNRELQHMLAATDRSLGDLLRRGGNLTGGLAALRDARAREALLTSLDPNDAEAWFGQARDDAAIADILEVSGDHGGAMLSYQEARRVLIEFPGPATSQPQWRYALAESIVGVGTVHEALGALPEALDAYGEARDILLSLVPAPNNTLALRALGSTDFHLAGIHEKRQELDAAADAYRDSLDAFTALVERDARDEDSLRRRIASWGRLAAVQLRSGDQNAALSTYREAYDALAAIRSREGDPKTQRDLAYFTFQIGRLLAARHDNPRALSALRESLRRFQAAAARAPSDTELPRSVWTVGGDLGTLLQQRGDLAGALAAYRDSATALLAAREKAPQDPLVRQAVGVSVDRIGSVGYLLLLGRDFHLALAAEEFALTLAPGAGWLVGNRAHALMFLGRTEEARAIYLGHRSAGYPDGKSWDEGTRADFAEMRKAGLHDPLMDEIEKAFAASR